MTTADQPPGPGWWKASDGQWYPPESAAPPPLGQQPSGRPGPAPSYGPIEAPSPSWGAPPSGPGGAPYAPGAPPYGAPAPAGQPRTNPMAVVSLVLGLLSFVLCGPFSAIPGLITGFSARRQIRESAGAEQGDGVAVAGIATSAVGLALSGVAVLAIIAVTFLGRSASSHFSVVGSPTFGGSTSTTNHSPSTTTASASATPSAAGKPCVPVSEPIPEGAPVVPVQVGPPPTELVKEDLIVGTGPSVTPGATLTVDYVGVSCSTGKIFDDSYSRGAPATFPLDQVIDGWSQGLVGMQAGGRRLLGIPPELAYRSTGNPPEIAPDETLWFVVELKSFSP